MTQVMEQPSASCSDLVEALRDLLRGSREPLTLPRMRALLPVPLRHYGLNELMPVLERQVAAGVVYLYPKYRSTSDRFWDRPVRLHIAQLVREALKPGPLAWSELRRRLPDYAKILAQSVLDDEIRFNRVFLHPPLRRRLGPRYGLTRAEPGPYLRQELDGLYQRMEALGFAPRHVWQTLLDILKSETIWASEEIPQALQETVVEDRDLSQTLIPEAMF